MREENRDLIRAALRDYLGDELKRPEVSQAKLALMAKLQAVDPAPHYLVRPSFAFAGMAAILIAIAIPYLTRVLPTKEVVAPEPYVASVPTPEVSRVAVAPKREEPPVIPSVQVKSVSSEVGSAMVYHRDYNHHPITVVWVFTGG